MAFFISQNNLDALLDKIALSDEEAIVSAMPLTWFQAHLPSMWLASTAYDIGDTVRPPTANGYIYECTVAGTSGSSEPAWGTTADATFVDGGTLTWKTHISLVLAATPLVPADFTKSDYDDGAGVTGRSLVKAEKSGIVTYINGTVTNTALLNSTDKTISIVTEAETTVAGDNDVIAGRTTIFQSWTILHQNPKELAP